MSRDSGELEAAVKVQESIGWPGASASASGWEWLAGSRGWLDLEDLGGLLDLEGWEGWLLWNQRDRL